MVNINNINNNKNMSLNSNSPKLTQVLEAYLKSDKLNLTNPNYFEEVNDNGSINRFIDNDEKFPTNVIRYMKNIYIYHVVDQADGIYIKWYMYYIFKGNRCTYDLTFPRILYKDENIHIRKVLQYFKSTPE